DPLPILEDPEWIGPAYRLSGISRPHSPAAIPHSFNVPTVSIIHPPDGRRDQNGKKTFSFARMSSD
ncbi:MAG: hypothetical protein QF435_13825, partial [Arenicellales bacterium]|nr:hypothetical protein [Arenicellales bacterium]